VRKEVQVDAFRRDIAGDQHAYGCPFAAEVVHDLLKVDVILARAVVQDLDRAGFELKVTHQIVSKEPDGLDPLAEKHEKGGGVVWVPLQLAPGAQFFEQILVFGEIGGPDGFDRGDQLLKRGTIVRRVRRRVGFQLREAGICGLEARCRAGEERLLQNCAEEKLAGALRAIEAAELECG